MGVAGFGGVVYAVHIYSIDVQRVECNDKCDFRCVLDYPASPGLSVIFAVYNTLDRIMPRYDFELYADCFQFHIQDVSADADQLGWSDEALARQLAVAPGVVGVGTVLNDMVAVSLDLVDESPPLSLDCWDHVVECSMSVQSGRILAAGWLGDSPDATHIEVKPDTYRVRVSYSVLDPSSETGLKEKGRYLLQLWPAPADATIVLKQGAV
ncbi:hypothetical protein [Thauera sinica]|uniref:Uncharacterized protein n=1 Tax=Thauera sinica TaxID=2665146 RepID=A0ABW1AS42_9RHOO|nr:hypothetical protein [Thauera sp. K11]